METNKKFDSAYDALKYEANIYQTWMDSGYFNPDKCIKDGITSESSPTFSIVLPPPNVTGKLHLGHTMEHSIQDCLVRYHRMKGDRTLWVPGTDHAAIATQSKFEKLHEKEAGKKRHDYDRDEFFKLVREYALDFQTQIRNQFKLLGSSLDWSREAFTLDQPREIAVRTAFKKMYDAGLIYQKDRIVNWDPKGQTTVSDDEIVHQPGKSTLYTFKYSADFPIPVATTRLETKVGDTAVAVHPNDERYQKYIGQTFSIDDFCGVSLTLKIIADENVDPEYGTGALGVTPAHSIIDWEMAEKNDLPLKQVINEYAKMTELAGELLAGQKTRDARETVANWLKDRDLILNQEQVDQNISTAERTGGIIEPLPKLQWWIDVNKEFKLNNSKIKGIDSNTPTTLKEIMKASVANGQVAILPARFEKIYHNWIDNLRDWNISRQIVFGHQMPVWYRDQEIYVGINPPTDAGWIQDHDTLDTWFSSALWTFTTLGWPDQTADLETYHPTDFMNPGYEILFFWVARMILMSGFLLEDIPFKTVYIHGMVRDAKGQKFSKSLNNGIEPEEIIEKYGTDALRMSMLTGVTPGGDIRFEESQVKAYRNFANKIWNATRFTLMSLPENYRHKSVDLTDHDQTLLDDFHTIATDITDDIENYRLHLASEKLYSYFWHTFADEIIESKKEFVGENFDPGNPISVSASYTLFEILSTSLKLLHPFMPFITEEIWKEIYPIIDDEQELLLISSWPINND